MTNAIFLKTRSQSDLNIFSWQYWCENNNVDLIQYNENDEIKNKMITYKKVGLINTDVFIKWDAPNIFESFNDDICGVVDTSDLNKIILDIKNSTKKLDIDLYLQTDVLFLDSKYSDIIDNTLSSEQLSINYNISLLNKSPKILYPCWNLYSIHVKDMFKCNWQLNLDGVPSFIKYAHIWNFNDLPDQSKDSSITDIWNYLKSKYK